MAEINHQIGIRAKTAAVYEALTGTEGLSKWWTKTIGDTANVGGSIQFKFNEHGVDMQVKALEPDRQVRWKCVSSRGEWIDTELSFTLGWDEANEQTIVHFKHGNWKEATPMLAHCTTKWGVFMLSLKQYLETGEGRPFPNDIHVNHS